MILAGCSCDEWLASVMALIVFIAFIVGVCWFLRWLIR